MSEDPLQSRVFGPSVVRIEALFDTLFEALCNTRAAADALLPRTGVPLERERILSSAMIVSPLYGTRASTVLCMTRDGSVCWEERSVTPEGAVAHIVREQFSLGQGFAKIR